MKKVFTFVAICVVLLAGCGGVTPIVATPTVTETPRGPEIVVTHPELEIITPDNVTALEEIGKWGESVAYDVAISPDRQTIAVRTIEGIRFYDGHTLDETKFIESHISDTTDANPSISFSTDGKYLTSSVNRFASIINLGTNKIEKHIGSPIPEGQISNIELSPDNQFAMVTTIMFLQSCEGTGGNYALYDVASEYGKFIFDRYFCYPSGSRYRFTSNNRAYFFFWYLASPIPSSMDVVDLSTGGLIESISYDYDNYDPTKTFYDVSPDGKVFASVEYKKPGVVTRLVDAQTGEVLKTLESEGDITFVSLADGTYTWRERRKWPNDQSATNCKILIDNGERFEKIVSSNNLITLIVSYFAPSSLEIWNTSKCHMVKQIPLPNRPSTYDTNSSFSPDGSLFVKKNNDNLEVWGVTTGQIRFVAQSSSFRYPINIFAFNNDGTRLITSTGNSYQTPNPYKNYSLDVWDTRTGALLTTIKSGTEYLTDITASPNDDVIVVEDVGSITFWNIKTGSKLSSVPAGKFAIDNTGEHVWIIPWTEKNNISLYDIRSGAILRTIPISDGIIIINEFYLDSDSNSCIVMYVDDNSRYLVKLDLQTGTMFYKVPLDYGTYNLKVQNNYFFAYGPNNDVGIWGFQDGLQIQSIYGASGRDLAVSPDNRILVSFGSSSSSRTNIRIWDIRTGKLITEISPKFYVISISFSPDGRLIAFGGDDGFIHVWGVKKP